MIYQLKRDVRRVGAKHANWYMKIQVRGKIIQRCLHTSDRVKAKMIHDDVYKRLHGYMTSEALCENIRKFFCSDSEQSRSREECKWENLEETVSQLIVREGSKINEQSIKRRLSICRDFVEWARKQMLASDLEAVTVDVAWQYVSSLTTKAKSKQNRVGELSSAWSMLQRAGIVNENPWSKARPQSCPEEERTGRAFTQEEIVRILDESRQFVQTNKNGKVDPNARSSKRRTTWLTTAIMLALYTGLRLGDVLSLRWEDYADGVICFTPNKTKRSSRVKVRVPAHPALCEFLDGLQRGNDEDTIVRNAPLHTTHAWNLCVERAGIDRNDEALVTFHSLRHTYATMLREAGAEKAEQMLLGGWTTLNTANRYDHDMTQLKKVVDSLPSFK